MTAGDGEQPGARLVLSTGAIGNPPVEEVCAAAVAGGFSGVATWPVDVKQHLDAGRSLAEYRDALGAAGLSVDYADAVFSWAHPYANERVRAEEEEWWLDAAAELGARCVGAHGQVSMPPVGELGHRFAELCDRAQDRGLVVGMEPAPWIAIPNPAAALEVLEHAGWPENGGIVVDSWHVFRACVELADVARLPAGSVASVQLSDGAETTMAWTEWGLLDETLHARRLPGHGSFDLVGFVRALDAAGAEVPVTLEVLSDDVRALAPKEAARRIGDAAREVLGEARAASPG